MAGLGSNVGTEFDLLALMNGVETFDDDTLAVWYFGSTFSSKGFMGDRFLPSEHIEVIEGQLARVNFTNFSGMPHTIHFHGLDVDQQNDGVPQTSFTVGPGESYTYEFMAPHAGTYHYHCHVDTVIHYHRGMAGTVIVRPPNASTNVAWTGGPAFDEEVLWHLLTYDRAWKQITESGPETARHRPDLFLLNGRRTDEAMTDAFTRLDVSVGETAYIRLVNSSYQWARVRLGGRLFDIVASDGRPMREVQTTDVVELGPGERYDLLFEATIPGDFEATIEYLDDYPGGVLGQVSTGVSIT